MVIPSNQISYNYTIGNEYILESNYQDYQGYYYVIGETTYVGNEFNTNAPILIRKNSPNINPLLANPSSSIYAQITGTVLPKIKVTSVPYNTSAEFQSNDLTNPPPSFYIRKLNEIPSTIKQVDERTYLSVQNNPLYKITFIGTYKGVSQSYLIAETQLPGLEGFLS
jgi:hypothetical protein